MEKSKLADCAPNTYLCESDGDRAQNQSTPGLPWHLLDDHRAEIGNLRVSMQQDTKNQKEDVSENQRAGKSDEKLFFSVKRRGSTSTDFKDSKNDVDLKPRKILPDSKI